MSRAVKGHLSLDTASSATECVCGEPIGFTCRYTLDPADESLIETITSLHRRLGVRALLLRMLHLPFQANILGGDGSEAKPLVLFPSAGTERGQDPVLCGSSANILAMKAILVEGRCIRMDELE